MKKFFSFALSLVMLLSCFTFTVSATNSTSEGVNVFAATKGASYIYETEVAYLGEYVDDSNTILNDGIVPEYEVLGETVSFIGTYATVYLSIDLGALYTDITDINFLCVCDSYGDGGGNRGFSGEKTKFSFSTNGVDFERSIDFTMEKVDRDNDDKTYFYDFNFKFDEPLTASRLKIEMQNAGAYILSLGEIEVISASGEGEKENNKLHGMCGNNITWTLFDNGKLVISGDGEMWNYHSDYNDAPWYSSNQQIKSVIIQNGVENIGSYAFYDCASFTTLTIPESVTSIGDYAFSGCLSLTSVTIPDSVKTIGVNSLGYYLDEKIENFTITGVKGSAAEAYANDNGFAFIALDITKLPQNDFYINKEAFTMPNVVENTKASEIVSTLGEYGITATITDKDGNDVTDKNVGTGYIVKTSDYREYTIIVNGDTDGNGKITSTDYLQIKNSMTGITNLSGCYKAAADTDNNDKITSTDYLAVKGYLTGQSDLYA